MPGVYEGRCAHCGHEAAAMDYGLAYCRGADDAIAYLHHPGEGDAIRDHGTTMDQALVEGRVAMSDTTVCNDCGGFNSRYTLLPQKFPSTRADWWFLIPIVVVAVVMDRVWTGAIVAAIAAVLFHWVRRAHLRRRYADSTALRRDRLAAASNRCEHCGGERLVRLDDYLSDAAARFRCAACGRREVALKLTMLA